MTAVSGSADTRIPLNKLLGFGGMAIGYFMAALDIQIVASSLTQIQAGVSATNDEISWVQTIYLLTEALIMPITAYLTRLWGTRPFLVVANLLFILTSVLTGFSNSIEMLIIMRGLQGLSAGALIPPLFATSMTIFSNEQRIAVSAFTGALLTLAPTLGPTIGGHLTELLGWRWLFFINVPVGALGVLLVWRWGGFDKANPELAKGVDWWGVGLMSISLLAAQYVLEEGARKSWLQSGLILWLIVAAVIAGGAFVWRQLTYRQPILSLRPMADRNFTLGALLVALSGFGMSAASYLVPLYLGQVRGYSSGEVGTVMVATGIAMLFAAPVSARIVRRLGIRYSMMLGFGLTAWSMFDSIKLTDDWGYSQFLLSQFARGLGITLSMIAAQYSSVATIPPHLMKDASGLMSLIRNLMSAFGLAMVSTTLTHSTAVHYGDLAAAFNTQAPRSLEALQAFADMMQARGLANPLAAAGKALAGYLQKEARTLAFGDAFLAMAVCMAFAFAASAFTQRRMRTVQVAGGGH